MPRSKRGDGGGGDDIRREEGLQAVLLADSFTQTFRPITYEVPKVLLPLVNAPMLEYTLELLANSGVVEVTCFRLLLSLHTSMAPCTHTQLRTPKHRSLCFAAARHAW